VTDFESLTQVQQLPFLLELAESALALYHLPEVIQVKLINLSENATYKVTTSDGRRWALRIHRDGYHSRTAIASELAWMIDIRTTGVALTPMPVKGRDGEIIQQVRHKQMPIQRNIVLFDWETGKEPRISENLSRPFEALGEVTARMHLHAKSWKRPPWFQRLTWDFETSLGDATPHWGHWRNGIGLHTENEKLFGRTVELIGKRLNVFGKSADRFGLIHCDLRLANLLMDGDAVKVIDFDDCGFGWYMYDAATPVSFYEHERHVPDLIEHWKLGYRRVLPLSKVDEAEIPTFVVLRRLLLVAWIGSRHQTDLAQSMGLPYTEGTVGLCEDYLSLLG
jgi:Ser/Thr protein kinase RdoA (MazF antagonist)